jgi:hypothetical protein
MAAIPTALFWRRLDTAGAEQAVCQDRPGLRAKGTMLAASPVPYSCRYELITDDGWAVVRCEITVEGAGFVRTARLERAAGRWRVTAGEQGNLDAAMRAGGHPRTDLPGCEEPGTLQDAMDVVIGGSALAPTPMIRRLGLVGGAEAEAGMAQSVTAGPNITVPVAWVLLPSLEVLNASWTVRGLGDGQVHVLSGSVSAQLRVDPQGYVRHYPGVAERA